MDRLFVPKKHGVDKDTQITENDPDLFNFDEECEPLIEVIFIFIPESWDINNAYLSRWKLNNIDFINVQKSNKFIINYLSKKFNIIDTTKDLQTASKIKDTNYFFDTHFNQYGNMTVYNTFKNFYNKYMKE